MLHHEAYDHIPCQVWTATPDGLLDYVNPLTTAYFCISAERLMARGWEDVCHPQDLTEARARWMHSVSTGEPYEHIFRLLRGKDRAYCWHLARANPVWGPDGKIAHWVGTNSEIDAIKRAEEVGQASAERADRRLRRIEEIFAHLPIGVIVLSYPDLQVERANPAALAHAQTAQPEHQAYASAFPEVAAWMPAAVILQCLDDRQRRSIQGASVPVCSPEGSPAGSAPSPMSLHCMPLLSPQGALDGALLALLPATG